MGYTFARHDGSVDVQEGGSTDMYTGGPSDLEEHVHMVLPALARDSSAKLAMVIARLIAALDLDRVFVFGSHARGEAHHDSDIDLLLVVPIADQPSYRLAQRAYDAVAPHSLDLDLVVMHRDEFAWRSRAHASLPATVLREGRLLYGAA